MLLIESQRAISFNVSFSYGLVVSRRLRTHVFDDHEVLVFVKKLLFGLAQLDHSTEPTFAR